MRNLTHVEGMSLDAMRAGIQWDFESYPEYLASIERRGIVPNVASFVGHSSVRTYVLGEDASKRAATDAEIAEMRRIVLEALRGRRDRLRHLHARAAQRRARHPHALAAGGREARCSRSPARSARPAAASSC